MFPSKVHQAAISLKGHFMNGFIMTSRMDFSSTRTIQIKYEGGSN